MGSLVANMCEEKNLLVVADLKVGASIKTLKMVYVCARCCAAFRANVCQMYVARRMVHSRNHG